MSQENAEYRAIKKCHDQLRLGCLTGSSTLCQKLYDERLITEDLRQLCFKNLEERECFAKRATELLQDRVRNDSKAYYTIISIMEGTHGLSYIGKTMDREIKTQNTAVQEPEPEKTGSYNNGSNGSLASCSQR